jgi:hypothetical protein
MWLQWLGRIMAASAKDERPRAGESELSTAQRGSDEVADAARAARIAQNTRIENVHADG